MGLKSIIKRILKKDDKQVAVSRYISTPVGSVDVFEYKENVLHMAGWFFDLENKMNNLRVAYYHDDKLIYSHKPISILRYDVADALGRADAEASGTIFSTKISSPKNTSVYLEYDIDGGIGGIHIGDVPGTDVKETSISTLVENYNLGNIRIFNETYIDKVCNVSDKVYENTIDIIIPVYNGFEYFDSLFSSLENTKMDYRLLIVNDKSTDERVLPYLEEYVKRNPRAVLLNNEKNLGFVGSVNSALKKVKNHTVLLNTDVVVPENWLERLVTPIICNEKIASATPYTNSGTICSFPNFGVNNEIFEGFSVNEIDEVFSKIKPQYPEMPTGVGFCMAMNFNVLNEIGLLDDETFGKGYGEENDWCQRAIKAGYKNVHVENLFVYHKHGGSFLSEEKKKLLETNSKLLREKYPDYERNIARYCQSDPARNVRLYGIIKLLNKVKAKKTVALDHALGGGATAYLESKKAKLLNQEQLFVTVRYNIFDMRYYAEVEYKKYIIKTFSNELSDILELINSADEIWINELVTWQNVFEIQNSIKAWHKKTGAHMKMLMHDFFALCPAINLMNEKGEYCEAPEASVCSRCIPLNKSNACLDYESGEAWRKNWRDFLESCDEVVTFSNDTKLHIEKVYPGLDNIVLCPHEPHFLPVLNKSFKTTKTLNIGILGILSYKKGLALVKKICEIIEEKQLNVRICLIGDTEDEFESPMFVKTGRYTKGQVPRLTLELDIDVFFIASIWPETFSYTTSEIMSMNMPLAVLDIGAPPERVKEYDRDCIISRNDKPEEILERLISFGEGQREFSLPYKSEKLLFIAEENSFASRYRVEHFQETLLRQGYVSDFYQLDDYIKENKIESLKEYRSVVFYRCSDVVNVEKIAAKAKEADMHVYYDIDDLVFDYKQIEHLSFLKTREYRDFAKKTEDTHKCMELADAILVSTKTLAERVEDSFPDKKAIIKRNVASMEMVTLSTDAWKESFHRDDEVWLGYFSGSNTHNKDFAIIENVILKLMEEYPQLHLRIGGAIKNSVFDKYENRIDKFDFIEWQKLPEKVASVDINLMPLEDTVFHWCKSENKWMEAGLVHVPSVVSSNKELDSRIYDKEDGFLCHNEEEWYDTLKLLIEDSNLRKTIGDNANKRILSDYTTAYLDKNAVDLVLS